MDTSSYDPVPSFVVGIGASAGGLEPIQRLFDGIPPQTCAAYVVVQHLSPNHNSMMKELLADHTDMPVHVIQPEEIIRADHVYLIPPGTILEVTKGRFCLRDKNSQQLSFPIDLFLLSLGQHYQERAIAVILSGSGTDGSRGVRTVSECGGIVMAQTPVSAQFASMPHTAIQTDTVDFVGSPTEIAQQLVNITEYRQQRRSDDWRADPPSFSHIISTLKTQQGIDFSAYRRGTLGRRIEKRMQILGIPSLADYSDYLLKETTEPQALTDEFLIGVTKFFRDTEAFEVLKRKVIPQLVQRSLRSDAVSGRLRLWVVGCSSGEEAYSLAILLYEYCAKSRVTCDFKIFATDIDRRAIKKASHGLFSHDIVHDVPPGLLETYFVRNDQHYEIHKNVRGRVVFAQHNVLEDPPFIDMDFISSRNMLIYVDHPHQETIIRQFLYSLRPEGYLFLGASESLPQTVDDFKTVSKPWKVFQKKKTNKKYAPIIKLSGLHRHQGESTERPSARNHLTHRVTHDEVFPPSADYHPLILRHYTPAFIIVNSALKILHVSPDASQFLRFPAQAQDFRVERVIDQEFVATFKNGIQQALAQQTPYEYREVPFTGGSQTHVLTLRFVSQQVDRSDERVVFVEFIQEETPTPPANAEVFTYDKHTRQKIEMLEQELRDTKRALREASHRSEATEEELQASNEELMSSNEEMQSTNEELQSVNEELYTVNAELQEKIGELSQLNNDINNLLESTEIGTIFLDHELNIRKFTPSIRDHFNVVDSDLGRPITHFSNNFGKNNIQTTTQRVLSHLEAEQHEVENESGRHFLMRINPFLVEDHGVKGVVLSFIDIEELKQAEQELLASNHFIRNITQAIPHVVYVYDHERRRNTYANRQIHHMLGYTQEEIQEIGDIYHIIHPDDWEGVRQKNQELMQAQDEDIIELEYRMKAADGQYVWLSSTEKVFHRNSAGAVTQAIGIAQDVSARKYAQAGLIDSNEELQIANQQLDRFVYAAAHDLQAPVSNLKNLLKLNGMIQLEEDRVPIQRQIVHSVDRLEDTLKGLISIIDIRKDNQEVVSISFKQALSEVMDELSSVIGETEAEITHQFSVATVHYIKPYLHSVILNLLSNAIKYASPDRRPQVHLTTQRDGNCVILTVKDNGIGIDLEQHYTHLFQPFERLHADRPGKGIGLSLIRSMVERNQGRIEVESTLGQGSSFHVCLKPYRTSS